ncbi:hypothetical protein FA95DRAFT_1563439 [Auriscalpium vulgare]|uniref:Uncharacterized protein n=1 Tax=Auriscalpium vulgare TaxID=40419 RepID=A0ACB8RGK5_9AGAM|nr:hypothetical protein FA95DRAFT_1563439 [Auriscalpium vulgare]
MSRSNLRLANFPKLSAGLGRPRDFRLTFLGTSGGGGPTPSRGCTATSLTTFSDQTWLIDCAAGTLRQIRRVQPSIRLKNIKRIFITHLHSDHVMGIIDLLKARLRSDEDPEHQSDQANIHLYGPPGLRQFVRMNLDMTFSELHGRYTVHELRHADDPASTAPLHELRPDEVLGRDIVSGPDNRWRLFDSERDEVFVDAAPLVQRVPCIGYVFSVRRRGPISQLPLPAGNLETSDGVGSEQSIPEWREAPMKIAILGDTSDASAIAPLAMDADAIVHEATNMVSDSERGWQSEEAARDNALSRGHSTARMAGDFARSVNARMLFLNHLNSHVADVSSIRLPTFLDHRRSVDSALGLLRHRHEGAELTDSVKEQAGRGYPGEVVVARDFLTYVFSLNEDRVLVRCMNSD